AGRKWTSRLGGVTIPGRPSQVAERFLSAVEEVIRERGGSRRRGNDEGLIVFASSTLGTTEGTEESVECQEFLETVGRGLLRRRTTVLLFRTSGRGGAGNPPIGGWVDSSGVEKRPAPELAGTFPLAPGVTDVGVLIAAFVRPEGP
ncbi:MAG TPA: hypothetical protein VJS68_01655, partial [Thermoplasmata archaeon]|nr:hypothetical protein [Thermoplasmata archaeon]